MFVVAVDDGVYDEEVYFQQAKPQKYHQLLNNFLFLRKHFFAKVAEAIYSLRNCYFFPSFISLSLPFSNITALASNSMTWFSCPRCSISDHNENTSKQNMIHKWNFMRFIRDSSSSSLSVRLVDDGRAWIERKQTRMKEKKLIMKIVWINCRFAPPNIISLISPHHLNRILSPSKHHQLQPPFKLVSFRRFTVSWFLLANKKSHHLFTYLL